MFGGRGVSHSCMQAGCPIRELRHSLTSFPVIQTHMTQLISALETTYFIRYLSLKTSFLFFPFPSLFCRSSDSLCLIHFLTLPLCFLSHKALIILHFLFHANQRIVRLEHIPLLPFCCSFCTNWDLSSV